MEDRITKLEAAAQDARDRLVKIDARMDHVEKVMATKTDLSDLRAEMHKEFTAQTWRIVGSMFTFGSLLSAIVFFIARNIH